MNSPRMPSKQPLIVRRVEDPNFPHVIDMMGANAFWAESLEEGHCLRSDDRTMVQMPVEVAFAFMRHHAGDGTELGAACKRALAMYEQWRRLAAEKANQGASAATEHAP